PLPILADVEAVPSPLPPSFPAEQPAGADAPEFSEENNQETEQALGSREASGVDAPGGLDASPEEEPASLVIDESKSVVYVAPDSRSDATIVRAEARIAGAAEAEVLFNNNRIQLEQSAADPERWTGSTIIFETDESRVFNPVVLPVLQARAASGATATEDISWDRIVPVKPSLMQQYFFMKQQDSGVIHSLLTVSSLYFTVMLALAIAALGLMVLIEIKKQRPRHIASGLGLIAILVLAIML
ncbi:MAG: hypothetical protein U1C18_01370, partial [Patescibacteria group bacterium]|nr:hypothetical protein [Patescibacteria group bacterium]